MSGLNTENHRLYATDYTRAQLGWIGDEIVGIADADVIVLSRDDIPALNMDMIEFFSKTDAEKAQVVEQASTQLNEVFKRVSLPEAERQQAVQVSLRMMEFLLTQSAGATGVDVNGDGKNDFGIIVAPDFNAPPEKYISGLSRVPASKLIAIPGDSEDAAFVVMSHEAGHIKQDAGTVTGYDLATNSPQTAYGQYPLLFENDADIGAQKAYQRHVDGGRLNPEFWDAFEAARAAGSLGGGGSLFALAGALSKGDYEGAVSGALPSHSTHLALEGNSSLPFSNEEGAFAYNDMFIVNDAVNFMVGMVKLPELVRNNQDESEPLSWRAEALFGDRKSLMEAVFSSPFEQARVGAFYTHQDPILAYAVVKVMQNKGWFDKEGLEGPGKYIESLDRFYKNYVRDIENDPDYLAYKEQYSGFIPDASEMEGREKTGPEALEAHPAAEGIPPSSPFKL